MSSHSTETRGQGCARDLFGQDRDETRDVLVRDRVETKTLSTLSETRPRRDVVSSREGLETETTSLRVSRYQKGKTNLDFTEARDCEWQWHQLGHMQVCTSLQTDNHASNPPLIFLHCICNVQCKAMYMISLYCIFCTSEFFPKLQYICSCQLSMYSQL